MDLLPLSQLLVTRTETPVHLTASEVLAPYMGVFFVAFFLSLTITPIMRLLAIHNGVVDRPDYARKMHLQPVAYLGGLALFFGWLGGIIMCFFLQPHDPRVVALGMAHVKFPFAIVIGAAVITLTGVLDDVYSISPRVKIGGQLFAAAALASQDVGTELVADTFDSLGIVFPHMGMVAYILGAVIIAVLVVVGCNAMNLLDGMDGLAAGVGGIATTGFLVISVIVAIGLSNPHSELPGIDLITSPIRIVMCLAILGTILGFLPYNFNPANIFMGDAGSLLLGYLCISTVLLLAHAPGPSPALVMAALIVFAMPFADTMLAVFRRKLAGRPVFSPDQQHLHHQLRKSGLSVKQTVFSLYALSTGFAIIGCLTVFLRWRYVLAIFFVLAAFIGVTALKSGQNKVLMKKMHPEKEDNESDAKEALNPFAEATPSALATVLPADVPISPEASTPEASTPEVPTPEVSTSKDPAPKVPTPKVSTS